jgi:hypothetical protein
VDEKDSDDELTFAVDDDKDNEEQASSDASNSHFDQHTVLDE